MQRSTPQDRTSARRDLAVLVLAAATFAALSAWLELAERVAAWTRPYERWQLDELPLLLLWVVAGLAWYAWRRAQEGRVLLRRVLEGQARLAAAFTENTKLARAAVDAQEDERRHLARELHDELGQYVNAIKIDAVWLRELGEHGDPDVRRGAESIVAVADHVDGVVRDLVRRLRPPGLDELGLAAALEHCIEGWRRRLPNVSFDVALDDAVSEVDEATGITLFRIAQEGLTNLARHARAANVAIEVRAKTGSRDSPAEIVLSMRDDGVGSGAAAPRGGLGLIGIRERVEALAGRFELTPGTRGFGFVARLPWRTATGSV
jgi:two-component system, NarL family, sensor histidine kinase UhpB